MTRSISQLVLLTIDNFDSRSVLSTNVTPFSLSIVPFYLFPTSISMQTHTSIFKGQTHPSVSGSDSGLLFYQSPHSQSVRWDLDRRIPSHVLSTPFVFPYFTYVIPQRRWVQSINEHDLPDCPSNFLSAEFESDP